MNLETTKKLRDRIHVEYINILENNGEFNIKYTYDIDKYIILRENFEKIKEEISEDDTEIDKFFTVYEYFKNEYKLIKQTDTDELEDAIINHNCVYNLFAVLLNSSLGLLDVESKVIEGTIGDDNEIVKWNQVKLDGKWYNLDLALDIFNKTNKKIKLNSILKNYLFTDEQFYKTHSPQKGNPELCDTSFNNDEKEEKNIAKRIFSKFKNIKKINRKDEEYDTK